MAKIIHAQSGHALFVKEITFEDLPLRIKEDNYSRHYSNFYAVKNWDDTGVVFMYLGKGSAGAPKQIVVWYSNGEFWSSFGKTFEDAINGAQKDGWMYATP